MIMTSVVLAAAACATAVPGGGGNGRTYARNSPGPFVEFGSYHKAGSMLTCQLAGLISKVSAREGTPIATQCSSHFTAAIAAGKVETGATAVVHVQRDPLDQILSGYFYHMTTKERWARQRGQTQVWESAVWDCPGMSAAVIRASLDRACSSPHGSAESQPNPPTATAAGCTASGPSYQEVLNLLPPRAGVGLEACRTLGQSTRHMAAVRARLPALGVPVKKLEMDEFVDTFNRTVLAVLDFAYAAMHCPQPRSNTPVTTSGRTCPLAPPRLRHEVLADMQQYDLKVNPNPSHVFDPKLSEKREQLREYLVSSSNASPLAKMIADARTRTGHLAATSAAAAIDIAKHQFLFVGGLQRSFTTSTTALLGQATQVSTQKISNYPREAYEEDQPWMRGMGGSRAAFETNDGGVEGKMVTDVYGEYVEFLALFCHRRETASNCKERSISAITNQRRATSARDDVRGRLIAQWAPFWDLSKSVLVEKTPENMFLAPFLQGVFGRAQTHFWFTMRHPLVWALAVDKWVENPASSIYNLAARVGIWVQAYTQLLSRLPSLQSAVLVPVEARLSVGDTVGIIAGAGGSGGLDGLDGLDHLHINVSEASRDAYVTHFCDGSTKSRAGEFGPPSRATKASKYVGTDWRSLIKEHECGINTFGYTFWGMRAICDSSKHNDGMHMLGYAPSLAAPSVVTGVHVEKNATQLGLENDTLRFRGQHVVLLPSCASRGAINGMRRRTLQLVRLFHGLGMVLHSICSDVECHKDGSYGGIVHTYDGNTRRLQLQQLLAADSCLPQKVTAVVDIQTGLLMQVKTGNFKRVRDSDGPTALEIITRFKELNGDPALIAVMDDALDVKAAAVLGIERPRAYSANAQAAVVVRTRVQEICGAADLTIAVSPEDCDHFNKLVVGLGRRNHRGNTAVCALVPYIPDRTSTRLEHRLKAGPGPGALPTALVVGNAHGVALASMVWFLVNVWPTVRERAPTLTYVVVGNNWQRNLDDVFAGVEGARFGPRAQHGGVDWESIGIKFTGRLPDEALEALYVNATVFVSPHRMPELAHTTDANGPKARAVALSTAPLSNSSSGISTKVMDAMGRGLAVVTNSQGAHGVGGRRMTRGCIRSSERGEGAQQGSCALYATDDVELMATLIVEMATCDRCRAAVEAAATRHVATVLSPGHQRSLFNDAVTGVVTVGVGLGTPAGGPCDSDSDADGGGTKCICKGDSLCHGPPGQCWRSRSCHLNISCGDRVHGYTPATCSTCSCEPPAPIPTTPFTTPMKVLLDNWGFSYHGEVVYSVMKLVHCLHPDRTINFVIDRNLSLTLNDIWHPHWPRDEVWVAASSGPLRDKMMLEIENDEPSDFELLVIVTAPIATRPASNSVARFVPIGDDARLMVVLHRPLESPGHSFLGYKSAWVAGVSPLVAAETARYFLPIELPVPPGGPPRCDKPPTYVIIGDRERRDISLLAAILQSERLKNQNFEIVWLGQVSCHPWDILCVNSTSSSLFADPRLVTSRTTQRTAQTTFNARMMDAAFMLPLCSPTSRNKHCQSYFKGHSTSAIAHAIHYQLRIVGHADLLREYGAVLSTANGQPFEEKGYFHTDDTPASVTSAFANSLADWQRWCAVAEADRKPWLECPSCVVQCKR